jgi:hypothetical protein
VQSRAEALRAAIAVSPMGSTLGMWICRCGQALWEECRFNGFYYVPIFHSDLKALAQGAALHRCPGCRAPLYPERVLDLHVAKAATRAAAAAGPGSGQ